LLVLVVLVVLAVGGCCCYCCLCWGELCAIYCGQVGAMMSVVK
jgi:hypothetical protein